MSKQIESLASTVGITDEKNVVPPLIGSYQNLDAEKVLKQLGSYGNYQVTSFQLILSNFLDDYLCNGKYWCSNLCRGNNGYVFNPERC
jgi:hypothetical protein